MHWPVVFKPGYEPFPKGEDGNPILDKDTTTADVTLLSHIFLKT